MATSPTTPESAAPDHTIWYVRPVAPRRRLAKADYYRAGMQLLAEGGLAAVTLANVCARLDVTKGSFYHHFDSAPAFHRELLAHYEEVYAHRRIEAVDAIADAGARMDALLQRGVERHHEAESAIRAWSRTDPVAAAVVKRVDTARRNYIAGFLVGQGLPEDEARVHADIALAIVAGAQAMSRITDRRRLHAMLDEHRRWLLEMIERSRLARAAGGRRQAR
jgi:AcrR family transcriptional regulator